MSLFKISHTLFLKTILLRKECFTNTFLTSAELSVPASLPLKISNRLLLFNFTAQRATRNKVLYISYVLSQHMYLAEHKSTGKKLLVSFLKNVRCQNISLNECLQTLWLANWGAATRNLMWQTLRRYLQHSNIWNVWKQSQLMRDWTQCVLPRIFLINPAILGQFPRRSPSVVLLPLLCQKPLPGYACPWDRQDEQHFLDSLQLSGARAASAPSAS